MVRNAGMLCPTRGYNRRGDSARGDLLLLGLITASDAIELYVLAIATIARL